VELEKLSQQLPSYISVVRADPDGKSIRFGLNDRYRVDLKMAGERVYLDILSNKWQGMPPSLPPEVVQDLVRRARAAEDALRRLSREQEKTQNRALEIKTGSAPQFRRAIVTMPRTAPASFSVNDGTISMIFDANFTLAEDMARARLAGMIRDLDIETGPDTLRVTLVAQDGMQVRAFREDDSITLDFTRADGKPIDTVAAPTPAPKEAAPPKAGTAPKGTAPKAEMPKADAPGLPGKKAETTKPETLPKALELALAATDAQPSARLEAGHDPQGFALRLKQLGASPLAIVQRGKILFVLVESPDSLRAAEADPAIKAKLASLNIQPLKGASLIRLEPTEDGAFWLRKEGDDILVERGRSQGGTEAFSGTGIELKRAFDDAGREALEANMGATGALFSVDDPVSGQKLTLVGAPAASFLSPKATGFAEFSLEPTLSGMAILPLDEALFVKRRGESVVIGHEMRLNLSALPATPRENAREARILMLDLAGWNDDRTGDIRNTEYKLMLAAAEAPRVTRTAARLRLVRYYMANALYPEAEAVLQVLQADDQPASGNKQVLYYRAFVAAMMDHPVDATRLLAEPLLSTEGEGKLIMGYVDSRAMRYPQALASFRQAMPELDRYPPALQAKFRRAVIETAIEAGDPVFAREQLLAYEKLPTEYRDPHLQQLLAARLADQQGRPDDALAAYTLAAQSKDRQIEAEARFGKAASALALAKIAPEDARAEFETLSMIWRRSDIEVKSLEKLGEFYAAEGRWREAFLASQRATAVMPEHVAARRLEDTMARRFEGLFLKNEGDKLSKVETLAIYQEFRQLVPVGRRGDEIARRLAERLFELDLVSEATEILEHQVRNRLEGVARASVATRLAVIYLTNRQPMQALGVLRGTRLATLPEDLRRARQLLEARALGDLYRTELAIELVAEEKGDDAERLRADIFWRGKKWREAGESYERLLGDAWQQAGAMSETQRLDALRSGLAYVLGDEKLSLDRLRGRYLAPMSKTEDGASFGLVTNDKFSRPQAFRDVARTIVNADTMTEFMSAYRKRYPESAGLARPVRSAGDGKQSSADGALPPAAKPPGAG
jgi:tetratricopeptide (TPR) repeat protein